jgi:hypothetical protein
LGEPALLLLLLLASTHAAGPYMTHQGQPQGHTPGLTSPHCRKEPLGLQVTHLLLLLPVLLVVVATSPQLLLLVRTQG